MFNFRNDAIKNRSLIFYRQHFKFIGGKRFSYQVKDVRTNKFIIDIYSTQGSVIVKVIKHGNNQIIKEEKVQTGRIEIPVYALDTYTFKMKYKRRQKGYVRIFENKE